MERLEALRTATKFKGKPDQPGLLEKDAVDQLERARKGVAEVVAQEDASEL